MRPSKTYDAALADELQRVISQATEPDACRHGRLAILYLSSRRDPSRSYGLIIQEFSTVYKEISRAARSH